MDSPARKLTWQAGAIESLINEYTRESGVRSLDREIASVCRKVAKEMLSPQVFKEKLKQYKRTITPRKSVQYLGKPKFKYGTTDQAGRDWLGQRSRVHELGWQSLANGMHNGSR